MPSEYPHLTKAPIKEAILDIAVEPSPHASAELLQSFAARVRETYPETHPIRQVEAQFAVASDSASAMSTSSTLGTICWSSDHTRATQARVNGFSVNHVSNYGRWDDLRDEARALWPTYVEVASPARVMRVALRYINRLELPEDEALARLRTRPQLGSGLPQLWSNYFMRVAVPLGDERVAVVTEALEDRAPGSATVGVILDIDVYSTRSTAVDDAAIWQELERLREEKNRFFFESLTKDQWEAYR